MIYRDCWEPLNNFFQPCAKLIKKERIGSKNKRYHDTPQMPCDRLLKSTHLSEALKKDLLARRAALFALQKTTLKKMNWQTFFSDELWMPILGGAYQLSPSRSARYEHEEAKKHLGFDVTPH